MIKDYNSFLNENLLKGKSEKSVKDSLSGKSHREIFNNVSEIFQATEPEDGDAFIQQMNEMKSAVYDNKFIIEILNEDWSGGFDLICFGLCDINAENIVDTLYKTLREYYHNYFYDSKEEYKEEHDKMIKIIERIDENTIYENINDLNFDGSEYPTNIYYKKNGKVVTLDYGDKILDCLK